jgi:peroxiredoxin
MRNLILAAALILSPLSVQAAPEVGKPAPAFSVKSIENVDISPSKFEGKIVVMEWTNPGCPFVHKFYDNGDMQALQLYAVQKDVVWLTVNSGAKDKQGHMDVTQARDYIRSNKLNTGHYILDANGALGKLYGAKTTPHIFVIDAKGNLAYMGAIDDKADTDHQSIKGAKNYVRDAIDSLLAGKPVTTSSTQPYGCSVKYAD